MLEHLVGRLKSVKNIDGIVLATSSRENDKDILDFVKKLGVIGFAVRNQKPFKKLNRNKHIDD